MSSNVLTSVKLTTLIYLINNRIKSILKVLIMQIYVLNNEEMKTIMNILIMIISDTSKDSLICYTFFLLKQCFAGAVSGHFTFSSLRFFFVRFFANEQNFAVLIKTRYFWRIWSLANSSSVNKQNP